LATGIGGRPFEEGEAPLTAAKGALPRAPTEREIFANKIAQRLDRPIGFLGVGALVLWLLEPFTSHQEGLFTFLVDASWLVITMAFLIEFVARAVVAPATVPFLRKHWWELGLVALPFLRFLRAMRAGRAGRGIASAVRSSRRAGERLRSRLAYLVVVTIVVACAGGRLLWEYGGYSRSYADALHDAALATLTGSSLGTQHAFAQILEVILAAYSVVIIATVAGALGAFFLEPRTSAPSKTGPWWEAES
jgi:voltage-gated potassium channel